MTDQAPLDDNEPGASQNWSVNPLNIGEQNPSPFGTLAFSRQSFTIPTNGEFLILEGSLGAHCFRITYSPEFAKFYHSSPGTGTRVLVASTSGFSLPENIQFLATWHPEKIVFVLVKLDNDGRESSAVFGIAGEPEFELVAAADGTVYQIGAPGLSVGNFEMRLGSVTYLVQSAIKYWNSSLVVVNTLLSACENPQCPDKSPFYNSALRTIISSFERYCKSRLGEMELEGYEFDYEGFAKKAFTKSERKDEIHLEYLSEARAKKLGILEYVIQNKRIYINNFSDISDFFKKPFKLYISNIELKESEIQIIKDSFDYRHNLTHYDPINNYFIRKDGSFVTFSKESVEFARDTFIKLVSGIHGLSLGLSADLASRSVEKEV